MNGSEITQQSGYHGGKKLSVLLALYFIGKLHVLLALFKSFFGKQWIIIRMIIKIYEDFGIGLIIIVLVIYHLTTNLKTV